MKNKTYDLEKRLTNFGKKVIELCKNAKKNVVTIPIIKQLIRSGTSIGANYCEANGASSRKDFKNKIHTCKKESIETKYWLNMLGYSDPDVINECSKLWNETQEYTLIFSKILGTMNKISK